MVAAAPRKETQQNWVVVGVIKFTAQPDEESMAGIAEWYRQLRGDMALLPKFITDKTALYYLHAYHELPWHYLDPETRFSFRDWRYIRVQRWQSCVKVMRENGLIPQKSLGKFKIACLVILGVVVITSAVLNLIVLFR